MRNDAEREKRFLIGSVISPLTAYAGGWLGNALGSGGPDLHSGAGLPVGVAIGLLVPIYLGARRKWGEYYIGWMGAVGAILGGAGIGIATEMVHPDYAIPAILIGAAMGYAVTKNEGSPPPARPNNISYGSLSGPGATH